MRLWDPYDMACIRVMEEMSSEISAMTFFEGWNLLVTGGEGARDLGTRPSVCRWLRYNDASGDDEDCSRVPATTCSSSNSYSGLRSNW